MKPLLAALVLVAALPAITACRDRDYTVPHDTLGCVDGHEYALLLERVGSAAKLNASAAMFAHDSPFCTVLHAGEVVSVIMGRPGEEAVIVARTDHKFDDPRLPPTVRSGVSYWANF